MFYKTRGFPDERFTLPVRTFRILFLDGRNCHDSAMIRLPSYQAGADRPAIAERGVAGRRRHAERMPQML
jgi:hypothetical protein